ncbi:hypothetical protein L6164_020487 [Bauhinia variegata]|uniref:Uncharacterized protein n=1 Tax=Bauhinia variegata TaxID=167791 RepID=A0ACB9MVJ8_BAUVA|nr:hypothetical protein L6164_020487 [Bauhinia variegata]
MDNWISRLVPVYVLCLSVIFRSASADEGFLSISCCADSDYTDQSTGLIYTSDYTLFSDRTSCRHITKPVINYTSYDRARAFHIDKGKRCFNLSTVKDQVYLLRGRFLIDESSREPLDSPFKVSIGVTLLGVVEPQDLEIEGVFRATKNYIDFCLVKDEGDPYISQLELRLLPEEYLLGLNSSVLKLISRSNLGNGSRGEIRYPDDKSDRIWKNTSTPSAVPLSFLDAYISNPSANVNGTPPLQVLKTAVTHPDRLQFTHDDLENGVFEYRLILYFLELNDTLKAGQRMFDIYVNNEIKKKGFDIKAEGSNYKHTVLNATANGSLNLTLIKASGSESGPLCNAYEIFQVRPRAEETNQTDLEVILGVRETLLLQNQANQVLESWSGDPCIPFPWQGVGCESLSGSYVITQLDLSSSNLKGPIPLSVTELTNLKILDLSHNDFIGLLPDSITKLPSLQSLYFGCNPGLSQENPSIMNSSLKTDYGRCKSKGSRFPQQEIIISTVTCALFLISLGIGALFFCRYREKLKPSDGFGSKRHAMTTSIADIIFSLTSKDDFLKNSACIQTYTLEYIEAATESYKTLIGEGGFGSVYRGVLQDGTEVAVKVRSATSTQGTREFDNELKLLSEIRHENLVPLLGYCRENEQQILVYPFMSNGSLQDRLYGEPAKRKVLDWPTRLSVALGAARGLTHLHTFEGRTVIHRDIKSSNILLDHSMCAKVADFGFSKYAPQEGDSVASLEVRGTAGYLDPEYYTTQQLSAKSDVYSFGVVLLEIVSGREPINIRRPRNQWSLVEWAKPYIRESKIDEIVDPGIKGGYHAEAMWRVVEVAYQCIELPSAHRPSMSDIVRELEDALIIENNASEYMRSIDSLGGSNRYSIVIEQRVPPSTPSTTESNIMNKSLSLPQPR